MAFTTLDHCPPRAFKLLIVGDLDGSLKRNLSACWSAEFKKDFCHDYYIAATTAMEVHTLHFLTNSGRIQFDCWDTNSAQESPRGLRDGYLIGAQCAMIIFDLNARLNYKYLRKLHHDLLKVCGDIPVVVCGINNMDMKNREVKSKQVTVSVNIGKKVKKIALQRNRKVQYYEISAESNYNFEKPFLYLARELVGYILSQFEHHLSTFDT
ncbi:unnamed protein product [Sphagnum jensenii]|uniref:GTP-binding nuclear protein n=1 Tax=Sphagnum jensenii TaxID=128206 RepID=A0ABP1B759_9BRYO